MERIFEKYFLVPHKAKYIRGPKPKSCIFCKIFNCKKLKESFIIYRDNTIGCILNIFPYNPGHILIFPRRHVVHFYRLTKEEIAQLFSFIQTMELLLNEVYGPHGFNIGLNIGNASGASIRHLHIHLVPRFKNELGAPEIIHKTKVFIEDLNTSYKKIRGKLLERLKKI